MAIELSAENKKDLIRKALKLSDDDNYGWVRDLYDDRVIVNYDDGKIYEVPYEFDKEGEVTVGEKKEVVVSYTALGEFRDVEILRTGTFTDMSGKEVAFGIEDLDHLVDNAAALAEELEPPLVATHKDGVSASIESFGHVHGGILNNVRRIGEKLFGDFKGVPERAVALLGEVGKLRLSAEMYMDYKDSDGRAHGPALKRVSVVDIPAIKGMAGITEANLFEESQSQPTTWVNLFEESQADTKPEEDKGGPSEMDPIKEKEEAEKRAAEEKKRADEAVRKLAEHNEAAKKKLIEDTVGKLTAAGLSPVAGEVIQAFGESLDNDETIKLGEKETTQLEGFTGLLDNLLKIDDKGALIVQFGESADTSGDAPSGDDAIKDIAAGIAAASPLPQS